MNNCPLCGSAQIKETGQRFLAPYRKSEFSLARCAACGAEYWTPLVADVDFYRHEADFAYVLLHHGNRALRNSSRHFLRRRPGGIGGNGPARLLDIGCGNGSFLAAARSRGYDVHGLDVDVESIAAAQRLYGLPNVVCASLDEYSGVRAASAGRFDVVTMFEVLEHQVDPAGFLDQARRMLAPHGMLVGSVPNRERFFAGFERRQGHYDLPPNHFFWFSGADLEALLRRQGFVDIRITRLGLAFREYPAWLQTTFFAALSPLARTAARRIIFRRSGAAGEYGRHGDWVAIGVYRFLKAARDVVFLPLALLTWPLLVLLNQRGYCLYFEAKRAG